MGLDVNGTRFLLYARRMGVDFARTAMVGRQALHLSPHRLKSVFASFGESIGEQEVATILGQAQGYGEPLLARLGAREVHSFDHSEYEGATHLHDMNRELSEQFKDQYTTVLDGGSLEHIFNFAVAIRNCMEMVRVGGHYLAITPANNFLGHGFYQFSPELYFSVFTRENGYELVSLLAFEDWPDAQWYSVRSPSEVRGRVTLINSAPVYLLVIARKITKAAIFATTPQQSDYVVHWQEERPDAVPAPKATGLGAAPEFIRRNVPAPVKKLILGVLRRSSSGFDPRFFTPMDPTRGTGRE